MEFYHHLHCFFAILRPLRFTHFGVIFGLKNLACVNFLINYTSDYPLYTVGLGDIKACVVFRHSLSCDQTAREDPRGLTRLDYGFISLSIQANSISYIGEIVKKVILLWSDFIMLKSIQLFRKNVTYYLQYQDWGAT